jgi:hypothetical protein
MIVQVVQGFFVLFDYQCLVFPAGYRRSSTTTQRDFKGNYPASVICVLAQFSGSSPTVSPLFSIY